MRVRLPWLDVSPLGGGHPGCAGAGAGLYPVELPHAAGLIRSLGGRICAGCGGFDSPGEQQRAAEKIEDIYAICKQLATNGIKASLATKEQRKRFVWAIRSRLSWLAMTMQNFHYYCMVRSHVPKKYSHNAVQQVILTDGQAERSAFEKAMVLVNDLHLW